MPNEAGTPEQLQPETDSSPGHETIRIPCVIGGLRFLACGFLKASEMPVDGMTMLERTSGIEGTRPINDEDWTILSENCQDFDNYPEFSHRHNCLVTDRRDPANPNKLSCFIWTEQTGRYEKPMSIQYKWIECSLVLRRCT